MRGSPAPYIYQTSISLHIAPNDRPSELTLLVSVDPSSALPRPACPPRLVLHPPRRRARVPEKDRTYPRR